MSASFPLYPAIEENRQIALSLLNPSTRDLEHGLALHRDAWVAESYSLGLHAPVVPEILADALDRGATERVLQDLREDQAMTGWLRTAALREEYQAAWEASGVRFQFFNAGEEGNHPAQLLKRLSRYVSMVDLQPDFLSRATTPRQLQEGLEAGKRCLGFSGNGVPLVGDHRNPMDELGMIRPFAQLGIRMMHLTYNRANPLGDGCAEARNGGLTDFGRAAIAEMNRCGILVDVAHSGWETSYEAAKASSAPIVVSHSTVDALHHHIRAKPDRVIRAVLDSGGAFGVTNHPVFLGGTGDLNVFLHHLDYMVHTYGADSVMIGTDSAYFARDAGAALRALPPLPGIRHRWENFWPPNDPILCESTPAMERAIQSLAWTNWPLFTVGLVQRGHSDEVIRKIIGGNLLRVIRDVWERTDAIPEPVRAEHRFEPPLEKK